MKETLNMDQKTIDKAQEALTEAIKLFGKLEKQSCDKAAMCDMSASANASITSALGYLLLAKGAATVACNAAPDVTPQFGGK